MCVLCCSSFPLLPMHMLDWRVYLPPCASWWDSWPVQAAVLSLTRWLAPPKNGFGICPICGHMAYYHLIPVTDGYIIFINTVYERRTRRVFTSESLFPPLHYKTHSIFKFPHISLQPISRWDATSVLKTVDFPALAAPNSQTHWHHLSVLLPEASSLLRTEQRHRGMFLKQREPQMKKKKKNPPCHDK